jgi:NitT/TauT family transport system ATP-binding protein
MTKFSTAERSTAKLSKGKNTDKDSLASHPTLMLPVAEPLPPKLCVREVSKVFRYQSEPLTVLENINLALSPHEFVCLVGASGCGKSTLLKIVAGLTSPSSGQVYVDQDLVTGPGSDRGMVFQSYSLFPWLTVAKNIEFGLKLQNLSRVERHERIAYYLDVVGLTRFANAFPKQLSGGMKQRAAIARALANEPEVLLMDEPFGALDAQTKEQLQLFMREIWERTHMTILMVTHDVEEAIFLASRVSIMDTHPGRIKQDVVIDLPEHRTLEMKSEPAFLAVRRQITFLL